MTDLNDFPDPETADPDGFVAITGDLSPDRLLAAYQAGIFPWFREAGFVFWFCPPQRLILFPEEIKVSHSMKQVIHSGKFRITADQAFDQVITGCAEYHQATKSRTWIDPAFIEAYRKMHELGYAHSIEVWEEDELAGGLYGLATGRVFSGESMFSRVSNASKLALIHLCSNSHYKMIDCQVPTQHLIRMGARVVRRDQFLKLLAAFRDQPRD